MNDPLSIKTTSPLKMALPLIAFLVIAGLWTGYWFYAKSQAQSRLASFEAETLTLHCGSRTWGGYPFRIHVDCTTPSISAAAVEASADKLRLIIQAWNPNHVIGAVFGPVKFNGFSIAGETIRFSHRREGGKLALASLLAENQVLTLPSGQAISMAKVEAHARASAAEGGSLDITGTASNLALEDLRMDSFTVEGTVRPDKLGSGDGLSLLSQPSEYLDAVWFVQRIAKLDEAEMNAAQQIIGTLLKENNNKLPVIYKDGTWYWGPFPLRR